MRLVRWPSKSNELRKKCVNAWTGKASAAFSNSFPIKLARNFENTSLIRCADNAAFSRSARNVFNGSKENQRGELG